MKKRKRRISITIASEVYDAVLEYAKREERSFSNAVEVILKNALKISSKKNISDRYYS